MAKEYNITRTSGQCLHCQKQLDSGEEFVATVRMNDEELFRADYCLECWDSLQPASEADVLGVWRSRVPQPQAKKKLLVDDELLINFFERLDGSEEPARIGFRFVLALVLMRKKLLVYDKTEKFPDGREVWTMHFRRDDRPHRIIDPHMDEEKIADVSQHLGDILEGEL